MMLNHKTKVQRARFPISSFIISFCIFILLILLHAYSDTFSSSFSKINVSHLSTTIKGRRMSSHSNIVIEEAEKIVVDDDDSDENQKSPIPPLNLTRKERILWFKNNLHNFKILNSNNITHQFHTRVSRFFNINNTHNDDGESCDCEVRFFMTWIAPANLFGKREILALKTLFKAHPQACLVIASRTLDSKQGDRILKPLIDEGFKVKAMSPDLHELFMKTPAESWLHDLMKGKKDPGKIPLPQNLSNLMRLVLLYKYGGVYLDTDFIILKSLKGLRNSIAAQSMDSDFKHWTRLNNAVLIFDKNHPLLWKFIEEFSKTFNGNKWGYNGPYMVSRVVERLKDDEDDFTVLSPVSFYPVNWIQIEEFFRKPKNESESRWVEDQLSELMSGETYGIHLWNKHSNKLIIEDGSVMDRLVSRLSVT